MSPGSSRRHEVEVRAGTRLGRYEILVAVAQGGMARVWAARQHGQRGFSKVVAIKTILPSLARDPNFEAMFLDEARLASGIHHPNVCEIFDLGEESGALYIAMEWVNGEALSRILKPPARGGDKTRIPIDVRTSARIIADAAKGLHAAHELRDDNGAPLGVVHRDVSPQNILVSLDGMVKVTDFGVAKALRPGQESTMGGQVKGKIAYMAPEQARGGAIDRRSDVFALGVVLYEITTGARPFAGDNEIEVMKSIASGYFEPPSARVPGYPRDLEAIVLWSMNLDPARRFPTADAMRHALEDWLLSSGERVTEAHVAALAQERVGDFVEARSARIRERTRTGAFEAYSHPEPPLTPHPSEASSSYVSAPSAASGSASHGSAPSAVSHVAPMVASAPPPLSSRFEPERGSPMKTAFVGIGIGLGVFALVAVGGGGFYVMKKRHAAAEGAPPEPPAALATASAQPAEKKAAVTKVNLVEPKSGVTLLIDSVVQPVGALEVPRPNPGSVTELTARAAGYEDKVFRIEAGTESIDIELTKSDAGSAPAEEPERKAAPAKPAVEAKGAPARASGAQKPAPGGDQSKGPVKIDVPDNPF